MMIETVTRRALAATFALGMALSGGCGFAGSVYSNTSEGAPTCGDGTCAAGETCALCPADCGPCPELCQPKTCAERGVECGDTDNGCGATLDCGHCPSGTHCNAEQQCECTPKSCAQAGAECGSTSDGCGHSLSCGSCASGQKCISNACCTPSTCAELGTSCGSPSDGCGGLLNCGTCGSGKVCDGTQCVFACGPSAVVNTSKCDSTTPYWCYNNRSCWDGVVDCWSATDCDGNGYINGGCECGYHYNCAANTCDWSTQHPACVMAVQDPTHCTDGAYPYYCAASNHCWSNADTDCATQRDCDGNGSITDACLCGAHIDCSKPKGSRCAWW